VLHWVCALGDLAKANAVLSIPGVQVNEQDNAGWTPLMIAGTTSLGRGTELVSAGNEDIVDRLLEIEEVDVLTQNRNGATALYPLLNLNLTVDITQQVRIVFTYSPSPLPPNFHSSQSTYEIVLQTSNLEIAPTTPNKRHSRLSPDPSRRINRLHVPNKPIHVP
jgi:hypothetical protein